MPSFHFPRDLTQSGTVDGRYSLIGPYRDQVPAVAMRIVRGKLDGTFEVVRTMKDREILLGVTGGIAAYKSADLCSKLVQAGCRVTVVMSHAAGQFIGSTTFEALTGRPVYTELFQAVEHFRGEHIGLAQRAELFVVAPATAHFLAQGAGGFAGDLLSTLVLTVTCPVLLAPAMNCEMWAKKSVQRNVDELRSDGVHFVEPGSGWLSCGQVGAGRMAEPSEILSAIAFLLTARATGPQP